MNYFIWGIVGFGVLMSTLCLVGIILGDED